jgi:hypothetical protein
LRAPRPDLGARLGVVEQLPLVEQHHDRAAGRVDALGEALVLAGDALGGVDHEQAMSASSIARSARTSE